MCRCLVGFKGDQQETPTILGGPLHMLEPRQGFGPSSSPLAIVGSSESSVRRSLKAQGTITWETPDVCFLS